LKLRLPELLLMRVDKITMATSVEARVPFLDHHLVEYALALPRSLKVKGDGQAHSETRARGDPAARSALRTQARFWRAGARVVSRRTRRWFDEHLMNSTMRRRDLLDYEFVGRMLDEHRNGRKTGAFTWALYRVW
jgi:asparagine synthase (glutamine-hydrolysing)